MTMPATATIDLLGYLLPDPAWAQEYHLEAPDNRGVGIHPGQPVYVSLYGHQIWEMKSSAGFPWDMNTFDEQYIYRSVTEQSWSDPTSFKIFASLSWQAMGVNGGIVWMPRRLQVGMFCPPIVTLDSTYRVYSGGNQQYKVQSLGGPIETHIEGPFEGRYAVDFGGSLGIAESCVRQVYKWGPGYMNMEVNYYARGYGRCQWELWAMRETGTANMQYVRQRVSVFNNIVSGGVPALDFPNTLPVIT